MYDAVAATLERLPRGVREWAVRRCRFVSAGASCVGYSLPSAMLTYHAGEVFGQTWVVLLSECAPGDELPGVIAHEIAHGWSAYEREGVSAGEADVCALVRSWGFVSMGAGEGRAPRQLFAYSVVGESLHEVGSVLAATMEAAFKGVSEYFPAGATVKLARVSTGYAREAACADD